MAQFITRIELHGANHNETPYEVLHNAMIANGFKRTIVTDDKKTFHLLTAEYEITGNYSTYTVLESAKQAVSKTAYAHSVFVSEVIRNAFFNLKPA